MRIAFKKRTGLMQNISDKHNQSETKLSHHKASGICGVVNKGSYQTDRTILSF